MAFRVHCETVLVVMGGLRGGCCLAENERGEGAVEGVPNTAINQAEAKSSASSPQKKKMDPNSPSSSISWTPFGAVV